MSSQKKARGLPGMKQGSLVQMLHCQRVQQAAADEAKKLVDAAALAAERLVDATKEAEETTTAAAAAAAALSAPEEAQVSLSGSTATAATLMITILRLGGREMGGVAEIRPDPHRSLADVFDRNLKGIGRLRVTYSPHHGFESTKTPITFDLSVGILRCCNAAATRSEI
jgi:hypothetical protein